MLLFLIAASAFASISLIMLGLAMMTERELVRERLRRHTQTGEVIIDSVEEELAMPLTDRIMKPLLVKLSNIAANFTPSGALQAIEDKLDSAGRPGNLGAREFLGLKVLGIFVVVLLGIMVLKFGQGGFLMKFVLIVMMVYLAFKLPDIYLQSLARARQAKILRVLADTLDLLTVSVEAGLGLDGAIQKVIEKLKSPLSEELDRALQEVRVGKARSDALRDMARRCGVAELTAFVAAICQAEQLGVSIAKVLEVQGQSIRTRRALKAREMAAKLPVKMLIPMVFFIFPALMIVILGPAVIKIFRTLQMLTSAR